MTVHDIAAPDAIPVVDYKTITTSKSRRPFSGYSVPRSRQFQTAYRRDGDTRIIIDLPTGIFGSGPDLDAAISDFHTAAAEHLDVLERQIELSAELAAQREYLRKRVRRSGG